jgi:hypothetical protein
MLLTIRSRGKKFILSRLSQAQNFSRDLFPVHKKPIMFFIEGISERKQIIYVCSSEISNINQIEKKGIRNVEFKKMYIKHKIQFTRPLQLELSNPSYSLVEIWIKDDNS